MTRYTRISFTVQVPAGRREALSLDAVQDRVQLSREGDVVTLQFHTGEVVEVPWAQVRYGRVDPSLGVAEDTPARGTPEPDVFVGFEPEPARRRPSLEDAVRELEDADVLAAAGLPKEAIARRPRRRSELPEG